MGRIYRDHNWVTIDQGRRRRRLLGRYRPPRAAGAADPAREYDGFECAIWHALPKSLAFPSTSCSAAAVRDRSRSAPGRAFACRGEMRVRSPPKFRARGYDCIKLKAGLEDDVVGWARRSSRDAPGMWVIIDPNQRWEKCRSRRVARLRELDHRQPPPSSRTRSRAGCCRTCAALRSFTATPVVLHVALPYVYLGQRPYEAISAIAHGAVDGFNFNCGLAKIPELDAIAHSLANLPCWHGSEVDLGILEAMYVHQAAAAKSCTWPSDIFGRMIRSHDLLKEPLRIEAPYVHVPVGPGLGIEPDIEAIERYSISQRTYEL